MRNLRDSYLDSKEVGPDGAKSAVAVKATNKISEMFHMDSQWDNLSKKEREQHRKDELSPKVEEFFAWAKGAQASAIIYSLVETAKANNLKIYDYFEFLITEISKHRHEEQKHKNSDEKYKPDTSYLQNLLPWSKDIQKNFHRKEKKS